MQNAALLSLSLISIFMTSDATLRTELSMQRKLSEFIQMREEQTICFKMTSHSSEWIAEWCKTDSK